MADNSAGYRDRFQESLGSIRDRFVMSLDPDGKYKPVHQRESEQSDRWVQPSLNTRPVWKIARPCRQRRRLIMASGVARPIFQVIALQVIALQVIALQVIAGGRFEQMGFPRTRCWTFCAAAHC
jgi:hypothetical protein